ncbi:hypothetical protein KIH23_08100 [Flavobacterium sp. CYK-55]|uniref:hypothetical protein n=1 Tax=Flavobacterium sp. CYK-55 TaxID=2835529 RepID=UPI001BCE590B|nr:hypothetical protein [Flavobacterium sp. CYK-55]MBS7787258.1 hypothetical protein [Flavobacterium sp. CYK-55]
MTANMTTLALNLLISERRNHRLVFAGKIIELLQQNSPNSEDEKNRKEDFVSVIGKCIQNPNCDDRGLFFEYAQYYADAIHGKTVSALA